MGGLLGLSNSIAERVAQIVSIPMFLGAYQYMKRRRRLTLELTEGAAPDAISTRAQSHEGLSPSDRR